MRALTSFSQERPHASASCLVVRPAILSVAKLIALGMTNLPLLHAAPTIFSSFTIKTQEDVPMSPQGPGLWIYLAVAMSLVLLGGAFAGLTIALMGQVKHSTCTTVQYYSCLLGRDLSAGH